MGFNSAFKGLITDKWQDQYKWWSRKDWKGDYNDEIQDNFVAFEYRK